MIIAEEMKKISRIQEWDKKGLIISIELSTAGEIVIKKKRYNEDGEEIQPSEYRVPMKVLEAELNFLVSYFNTLKFLAEKVLEIDKNALSGLEKETVKFLKEKNVRAKR